MTCTVGGCELKKYARTLCRAHYRRFNTHGEDFDRSPINSYKTGPNAQGHKGRVIKYLYGITPEQHLAIWNAQDGKCAICKTPVPLFGEPGKKAGHIDHDHECCPGSRACGECVRGILCHHCNHGLGHFKDSTESLITAAAYLRNSSAKLEEEMKECVVWQTDTSP